MASKELSFEEWLVPVRSRVQEQILKLLVFIRQHEDEIKPSKYSQILASLLAGIGFSLWRAVFLADSTDREKLLASIDKFLETVVRDNAIMYRDDKNVWSFGYYTENARNGLLQLEGTLPPAYRRALADFERTLAGPHFFNIAGRQKCELLVAHFEAGIAQFQAMVIGPNLPKLWTSPEEKMKK
jgi:hypothetical protein